jgi:hypothetical protein
MPSGTRGSGAVQRMSAPTMRTRSCRTSNPGKKCPMMNIILNGFSWKNNRLFKTVLTLFYSLFRDIDGKSTPEVNDAFDADRSPVHLDEFPCKRQKKSDVLRDRVQYF